MSYLTQAEIAVNGAMYSRVAQAAASEAIPNPDAFTAANSRTWAAAPGWDDAWESSRASHPEDPDWDPGTDEAVITDGMILSEVQRLSAPAVTPQEEN